MFKTRMPRLLEINLRRWLHDRKLPEVTQYEQLPNLDTKIATKSPIKEDEMKLDKKIKRTIKQSKDKSNN
jgi:hypothetical protein